MRRLAMSALALAACGAPEERSPIAHDQVVAATEDQPVGFVLDVTDPEQRATAWTVSEPSHGQLVLAAPAATYTPDPDFHGTDLVELTVADDDGHTTRSQVRFEVAPVDDAPRPAPDSFTADEDAPLALATHALLANDVDVDGQALRVIAVRAIDGGSARLGDQELWFTPAVDHVGLAHLTYTVSDGALEASSTVTLRLTGANDPPAGEVDALTTDEDRAVEVAQALLLRNDTDPDGDTLSITAVGDAVGGSAILDEDLVRYTPDADWTGAGGFDYQVSDGRLERTVHVDVAVRPVDDPPRADSFALAGAEDQVVLVPVAVLRAHAHDPDGDPLTIVDVGEPAAGSVGLVGDEVRFWPAPDATGAASFVYTVSDGQRTASARVAIDLGAVDDPPVASPGVATTVEDQAVAFTLAGHDIDSAPLGFEVIDGPAHGALAAGPGAGDLVYQPEPGFGGEDRVTFVVHAGGVTSPPAQVRLVVEPIWRCGDTILDPDELCDDGNLVDGDGCDHICTPTGCGNGVTASPPVTAATLRWLGASCGDPGTKVVLTADDLGVIALPGGDGDCGCDEPVRSATVAPAALTHLAGRAVLQLRFPGDSAHLAWAELEVVSGGLSRRIPLYTAAPHADGTPWPEALCQTPNHTDVATATQLVFGEECDDGNLVGDDGCSQACTLEVCGDGAANPGEACDDGNLAAGDGCSPTCTIEPCGDGTVAVDEACDDGNLLDGDGCSRACALEVCGDGVVQPALGEECDDGNLVDGDGCSATCLEG